MHENAPIDLYLTFFVIKITKRITGGNVYCFHQTMLFIMVSDLLVLLNLI
jgi:hypothetical protein